MGMAMRKRKRTPPSRVSSEGGVPGWRRDGKGGREVGSLLVRGRGQGTRRERDRPQSWCEGEGEGGVARWARG
jgi:hypothetical protein